MNRYGALIVFLAVFLFLFINGCASLSVDKMIPEHCKMNFETNGYTIKIGAITANNPEDMDMMSDYLLFGDNIKLDSETFKKAITAMMERSQLFKNVVLAGAADYELNANIELQGQRVLYSMKIESLMKIHYELVKVISNEILWQEDINTTGSCTIKEVYAAVPRANTAVERAVKKNLMKCIEEISKYL